MSHNKINGDDINNNICKYTKAFLFITVVIVLSVIALIVEFSANVMITNTVVSGTIIILI